uniref:Putative tail protein n=1 Tax=viral metagenome TaxID=1070528 RepID=A0A6M3JNG7_9ZZZZ
MASTLAQIRAGIATRLRTITGLRAYPYPVDNIAEVPAVVVATLSGDFLPVYSGAGWSGEARLVLLTGEATSEESWAALDVFLQAQGASSINAAFDGDTSLGLTDVSASIIRFENAGRREVGDPPTFLVGADFILRIEQGG